MTTDGHELPSGMDIFFYVMVGIIVFGFLGMLIKGVQAVEDGVRIFFHKDKKDD